LRRLPCGFGPGETAADDVNWIFAHKRRNNRLAARLQLHTGPLRCCRQVLHSSTAGDGSEFWSLGRVTLLTAIFAVGGEAAAGLAATASKRIPICHGYNASRAAPELKADLSRKTSACVPRAGVATETSR
jgi:hypothetical protein